jgi:hypothetical protein
MIAVFSLETLDKLAAVFAALFTFALAVFSWKLVRETRKMWIQNRLPHVIVTIEPTPDHPYWMELVVENAGEGPAFDVVATLDPDIVRYNNPTTIKVSETSLLRMPVLKGRQRFSNFVGEWMNLKPQKSTFHITCKDSDGKQHKFTNEVDLSTFKSLLSSTSTIDKIADELKKIRELMPRRLEE